VPRLRVGIDVGGTNTDAALVDGERVIDSHKTPTTADITGGVTQCMRAILASVNNRSVKAIMIGTTHFTNAFVEGRDLLPTAVIRLGLPATSAVPPQAGWPTRMRSAVPIRAYLCRGGHEVDGRELAALDRDHLRRAAEDIAKHGTRAIAVSSVFSPMHPESELAAAALLRAELPDVTVSISHEIGRLGLLERENATIINASLGAVADRVFAALESAVEQSGVVAPVFLTQNDGTLMTLADAKRYPVATFSSGPTNSMRGAALLSGLSDCAVVDIGGTTTDVGILHHGFPRESSTDAEIAGIRTNFRMPDTFSIGVGGGSVVKTDPRLSVGPGSVGYKLLREARIFGGSTLTATDIAVASGRARFGDARAVADLDPGTVRRATSLIDEQIAEAVDRVKTRAGAVPVVVVGGGSVLMSSKLDGASEVIRPNHGAVANAVGAAVAEVGGEVDVVVQLNGRGRQAVLEQAQEQAHARAIEAGAARGSVRLVDLEATPLTYLPGNALRVKAKAVGELDLERSSGASAHPV
jgi:N-methylhydantoinase A/oxoprolinase/acetone carboxylase beta subunit